MAWATVLRPDNAAVLLVWQASAPFDIAFSGCSTLGSSVAIWTLGGGALKDQNYPGQPQLIWPKGSSAPLSSSGKLSAHSFLRYSFTTLTVACEPSTDLAPAAIAALQPTSSCAFTPPPPPPPPPAPFTWQGHAMSPSGTNAWKVLGRSNGGALLWNGGSGAHGRAIVKDAGLPALAGSVITVTLNLSFPLHGLPTGPTSLLLRFNGADKHIGPGADDWSGYECAVQPGRVSLGFHNHDYTALNATSGVSQAAAGKPLVFQVVLTATAKQLSFVFSIDGVVVADFAETDAVRMSQVKGSALGVRGFDGDATFYSLSFHHALK